MKTPNINFEYICDKVEELKGRFGKCNKFTGALTIELLKLFFADKGIITSSQNVFIEGIPKKLIY